ncbi:DNA-binding transcriptional regulator, MarR family [Faunimonas pinastri]|uniref:DNA-binding transcriptional regulator, MarR family n=1 Tax=Faunimonas pinastri TaxID=1855383 RepID=A0A1H9ASV8_9HYPH|nr:MarR family transcriptional regulator [Faunimonas pinastri]SEP79912.1 DNA-binding transcriptional regulator, MarR family [Faunimonas pinastri]
MADIINAVEFAESRSASSDGDEGRDVTDVMELLFFSYRDFVSDPDEISAPYGFGRAHHRVLHFVNFNPGLTVADLLDILQVTKQSLGRVLKELVDLGFIEQKPGLRDRRQRLLFLTPSGKALNSKLESPQYRRIRRALEDVSPENRATILSFLFNMIDSEHRPTAARVALKQDMPEKKR